MSADFLEGDFDLLALPKPQQDLNGCSLQISTEKGLRLKLGERIAD